MRDWMRDHEKFIAFMALLVCLMLVVIMLRLWPLPDNTANSGVLQILNLIVGALIGGFGAAVQTLLKATVTVDNKPNEPVPTAPAEPVPVATSVAPSNEELPDYAS